MITFQCPACGMTMRKKVWVCCSAVAGLLVVVALALNLSLRRRSRDVPKVDEIVGVWKSPWDCIQFVGDGTLLEHRGDGALDGIGTWSRNGDKLTISLAEGEGRLAVITATIIKLTENELYYIKDPPSVAIIHKFRKYHEVKEDEAREEEERRRAGEEEMRAMGEERRRAREGNKDKADKAKRKAAEVLERLEKARQDAAKREREKREELNAGREN